MSCLFPAKENPKTPHSHSFSLMMSEMSEKSFKSPGALDSRRVKFPANSMSLALTISRCGASTRLRDAHFLGVLRLEAVLLTLCSDEVADILVVRVHELVDTEDNAELLPLPHDVVVGEEGDVDGVLEVRRLVARVVVCVMSLMTDSVMGRALSA